MTGSTEHRANERVTVLGCSFDLVHTDELADKLIKMIQEGGRGYVCTVNVSILMAMRDDPFLARFIQGARYVVADGQPIVWVSSLFGAQLPERVTGIDLIDELCQRAVARGTAMYCLGAQPDVIAAAGDALIADHPGLKLFLQHGHYGEDEIPSIVTDISDSSAKMLIVGMGVPRQELFIADNWLETGVPFAMGVGGSFDVIAGIRSRAPRLVQTLGLEWLYRLVQEPRRLFWRYLTTNTRFIFLILKEIVAKPFRTSI